MPVVNLPASPFRTHKMMKEMPLAKRHRMDVVRGAAHERRERVLAAVSEAGGFPNDASTLEEAMARSTTILSGMGWSQERIAAELPIAEQTWKIAQEFKKEPVEPCPRVCYF